ncbi:MAG: 3-dehydroquinate synthase [Planctomycetota bacterium]|nr:3-dehydroquinate synthase [Planctomycetota bacterium]
MSDDPRFETEIRDDFQVGFTHRLLFGRDTLEPASPVLRQAFGAQGGGPRPGMVAVIDSNLAATRPELASALAHRCEDETLPELRRILVVPGGEAAKNDPAVVDAVLAAIEAHRIDRRSYVAIFGGGAVIDAAGFAASTAHRGVRVVRFASTVLAQLDAAIGVKNGVNRFGKKNFQGCFDVPTAVVCDERMLESLDDRDWRSGFSEAVKIACLKDPAFLDRIEADAARIRERDADAARPVIHRCAELHLRHISRGGDPFERAEARPLDFGHGVAHRLESISDFQVTHGEAVSIGIAVDTVYSELDGRLDPGASARILSVLRELGLPVHHDLLADPRIFDGLEEFREHLGGRLTVTLLEDVGRPVEVHAMDRDLVNRTIGRLGDVVNA